MSRNYNLPTNQGPPTNMRDNSYFVNLANYNNQQNIMRSAREREQRENNAKSAYNTESVYYDDNNNSYWMEKSRRALIEINTEKEMKRHHLNTSSKYNYVKPSGINEHDQNLNNNFNVCQNFNYDVDNSCCRLGQCALITFVTLGIILFIISIIYIFHIASHEDNYIRSTLWFPIVSASLILFVVCCIPIICLCLGLFMNNIN